MRRLRSVGLAGAVLVAAAGCGSETRIDGNSLETAIAENLVPDAPETVGNVTCPDVGVDPGVTVTCTAVLAGTSIDVEVTTGEAEGSVVIATTAPLVDAGAAAELIAARFTDELELETTVDCGPPVAVLEEGESLVCTATDPRGVERVFDVTVDETGELDLTLR